MVTVQYFKLEYQADPQITIVGITELENIDIEYDTELIKDALESCLDLEKIGVVYEITLVRDCEPADPVNEEVFRIVEVFEVEKDKGYRIWDGKTGLSFSAMHELMGEDDPFSNLKLCVMDLSEALIEADSEVLRTSNLNGEAVIERDFVKKNLSACLDFAIRQEWTDTTLNIMNEDETEVLILRNHGEGKAKVDKIKLTIKK